ncbi:hypothetical protein KC324_g35 [Hortaea werneckii]|nr:hypothetical protein KC324_g35 [Hortaea werneckii]
MPLTRPAELRLVVETESRRKLKMWSQLYLMFHILHILDCFLEVCNLGSSCECKMPALLADDSVPRFP